MIALPVGLSSDGRPRAGGYSPFCSHLSGPAADAALGLLPRGEEWLCQPIVPVEFATVTLPDLLARVGVQGGVAVAKLDCEGCEFDALRSPGWDRVQRLAGELHTPAVAAQVTGVAVSAVGDLFEAVRARLCSAQPAPSGCSRAYNASAAPA